MKNHKTIVILIVSFLFVQTDIKAQSLTNTYKIVDTGVEIFYSNNAIIQATNIGEAYYGQDASYQGNQPAYTDNGNGTITDNVTGLMWQQDMGAKISYADAFTKAGELALGGYDDWRVPTIKELYSLILFTGMVKGETAIDMFIDTDYFTQPLGNTDIGERLIDAQTWSATEYVGKTMNNDATVFGVNFIDGRIKGYPKFQPKNTNIVKTMYFRMVRGNPDYGKNNYVDNENGTITDKATNLMWQQADDGISRDWETALSYAEGLEFAGHTDWRLPNAKELQSIVDYTRSPQTTNSPAIDDMFATTEINDPEGNPGHYPFFWTGTTHLDGANPYSSAVYIAFGEALGKMHDKLLDVHGAGAQRSDPKSGDANDYPAYFGPQGDVRYVYNYVRCVRTITETGTGLNNSTNDNETIKIYPNPVSDNMLITFNLAKKSKVGIDVYTTTGTKTDVITHASFSAGNHVINWNLEHLKNSVYFIKMKINGKEIVRKITKFSN